MFSKTASYKFPRVDAGFYVSLENESYNQIHQGRVTMMNKVR